MRKSENVGKGVIVALIAAACASSEGETESMGMRREASICRPGFSGSGTAGTFNDWHGARFRDVEMVPAVAPGGGGYPFTLAKPFVDAHERPVARMGDDCTGTLLGDGLLLTASSCNAGPGTVFTFGDQLSPTGEQRPTEDYVVAEVLEDGANVGSGVPGGSPPDHALLRLYRNPENRWGAATFDPRMAVADELIAMVHHPQTARPGAPSTLKVVGEGWVDPSFGSTSLPYRFLDTDVGSRGAGVLSQTTGTLIGVHREPGSCDWTNGLGNSGVPASWIGQRSEFLARDHGSGSLYATAPQSGIQVLGGELWDKNDWPSSWRHVVVGNFGGSSFDDLFFYDSEARFGRFYSVESGNLQVIGAINGAPDLRRDWTQIVPLQVVAGGLDELFFYDWRTGDGKFYSTDGAGHLTLLKAHSGLRSSWHLVVAGDFTSDAGSELLFYDPTAGELKLYTVASSGSWSAVASATGFGANVQLIVPGQFHDDAGDEILVYDTSPGGGGKVYRVNDSGQLTFVSQFPLDSSLSQIVVSSLDRTDFMGYSMSSGLMRSFSALNGAIADLPPVTGLRRSWSKLLAGDFTSSPGREILFYDRYHE